MPLEETKKTTTSPQRYRQKKSTRFGAYSDAKEAFDKVGKGIRKRLRKRNNPAGVFDVLIFEKIAKNKKAEEETTDGE